MLGSSSLTLSANPQEPLRPQTMGLLNLSEATTQLLISCEPLLSPPLTAQRVDALTHIERRFGPPLRVLVEDLGPRLVASLRQRSGGGACLTKAWATPREVPAQTALRDELVRLLGRSPDLVLELRKLMNQIGGYGDSGGDASPAGQSRLPSRALWWHLRELLGSAHNELEAGG